MNDLLSNMLRMPMAMAQMGAEQLQKILNQDRNGNTDDRTKRDRDEYLNGDKNHAGDFLAMMLDSGQRMLDGLAKNVRHVPGKKELDSFAEVDDFPTSPSRYRTTAGGPQQNSKKMFATAPRPSKSTRERPIVQPSDLGRLDVSTLVVVGEGLAAGVGDFSLSSEFQSMSFPAQLARHLDTELKQPLFEAPGIGCSPTCKSPNVRFPDLKQTTVFLDYPPSPFGNLSVPGFLVGDCLRFRPRPPLVHQDDVKQTLANVILDLHGLTTGSEKKLCTQLEAAIEHNATTVILALGFRDVLEPALTRSIERLPSIAEQRKDFTSILKAMESAKTDVIVLNVPDPLDTACFSSIESAARVLRVSPMALRKLYLLEDGDYLTVAGLLEIGAQINRGTRSKLNAKHVLPAKVAMHISSYAKSLNEAIAETVGNCDRAYVCDVSQFLRGMAQRGEIVGGRRLSADFLGGFYGLNGFSPGFVGHGLIANEVIGFLNGQFSASIPLLDMEQLLATDPVASYRIASGRDWTDSELETIPFAKSQVEVIENLGKSSERVLTGESLDRRYNEIYRNEPTKPLTLPPGLVQELPLNKYASHHGDAMRVINCQRAEDIQFGDCASNVFDGLAMFGGHLEGSLRFTFSPPINNNSHFEIGTDGPLTAEDGVLSTPDFLRFPLNSPRVVQPPGKTCSGDVNLVTGQVSNLNFMFIFENSGLRALQDLNPLSFPSPAIIRFKSPIDPQEQGRVYGTAWARFKQRPDGRLDFLFHGTAFVPMGPGFQFALPLGSPDGDFAAVPANGTQLHPHLYLSTEESSHSAKTLTEPMIPTNAIREFTADSSRTCFGDDFHLNHPELGFGRGRSYLTGRIMIQFGERFGDSVPFTVSMLPPGGLSQKRNLSPLQDVFPGQLGQGMEGHDTVLRFPLRTYRQNDLYLIDDPFDIAIGAVNIYTGEVIGDFLHRALLGQAMFFALVRVEPRTPQGSFEYRGPSMFERGPKGQLRYRFNGTVFLPYQEGFRFPLPDLTNSVPIGPDSQLDPFFQIEAVDERNQPLGRKSGSGRMQLSNSGDRFSYQFSISNHSKEKSTFEYTNHSQNGQFRMSSLAWLRFTNSKHGSSDRYDTVTFSGFGQWSLDKKGRQHIASVQVSTASDRPFVSILVDGGNVSNVNTRPNDETQPLTALENETADSSGIMRCTR